MRLANSKSPPLSSVLWSVILLFAFASPLLAGDQKLVSNPPPEILQLTVNEARSIFSMRVTNWPDGTPITVYVMPVKSTPHRDFVRTTLKLLPHQLKRKWDRLVYTGTGMAPIEVKDASEMRERVLNTPGSVGYLNSDLGDKQLNYVEVM